MRKKLMLLATAAALGLGQPPPAQAAQGATCEDLCGERAAKDCDNIDSFKCAMYIIGCLAGCSVQKIVSKI